MILCAVVVTYYPEEAELRRLVNTLRECSARVILVDNTPQGPSPVVTALAGDIELIDMHGNAGIAAAQNAGIRAALAQGAEVLAFFDQDSMPDQKLLPSLVAALGLPPRGIAAPVCIDVRTGAEYPPYRFNRWGWARPTPAAGLSMPLEVDLVISSGSVAAVEVFSRVGLMDEDFFIDYVDLEWCIRCRKVGISIRVLPSVTMPHAIGIQVIETGPLTTFVHNPMRCYYRLRNALLLIRLRHVPRLYVLHEVTAALLHHLLQWRQSPDPGQHARFGWRGLVDGLRGVRGKFEQI
jgi:rhamnosyltransferase